MPEYLVCLPLGAVQVSLERCGMSLGARGGFDAQWGSADDEGLSPEAYRKLAKAHLKEVYLKQEGSEPPSITLNLASHQLIDDLIGWSKLNYQASECDKA